MSVKSTVVLSLLCAASAKEWSLNSQTSASVVAGVGAGSDTVAAAAASQNGVGAVVERLSGAKWTKKAVETGMLLDTAVTPSGVTVATSIWKVFVSTDGGETYNVAPANGVSQSANTWGSNKENLALVGNWVVSHGDGSKPEEISGVATSMDSGASWKLSAQVPPAYARYGAFPSDKTWYVASGIWGSSADKLEGHRFSSRMHLDKRGYTYNEVPKGNSTLGASGWFGAVSKTTDGGATWTQVFTTNEDDVLYFNGISCSSETHCVVVGEGYNADGSYLTAAYTTFDGSNWTQTLTTSDVGLMQADLVSDTEGWLVGTSKDGRNLYGQFYHTVDGGKTWNLEQSLNNCFAIDMDFAETTGFAACSSSSGSSCSVAQYV